MAFQTETSIITYVYTTLINPHNAVYWVIHNTTLNTKSVDAFVSYLHSKRSSQFRAQFLAQSKKIKH